MILEDPYQCDAVHVGDITYMGETRTMRVSDIKEFVSGICEADYMLSHTGRLMDRCQFDHLPGKPDSWENRGCWNSRLEDWAK